MKILQKEAESQAKIDEEKRKKLESQVENCI